MSVWWTGMETLRKEGLISVRALGRAMEDQGFNSCFATDVLCDLGTSLSLPQFHICKMGRLALPYLTGVLWE